MGMSALFGLMMRLINDKFGKCDFSNLEGTYLLKKFRNNVSVEKYFKTNKREEVMNDTPEDHSLPYCVRNYIDHPNDKNKHFGEYEVIKKSINQMIEIIGEINKI